MIGCPIWREKKTKSLKKTIINKMCTWSKIIKVRKGYCRIPVGRESLKSDQLVLCTDREKTTSQPEYKVICTWLTINCVSCSSLSRPILAYYTWHYTPRYRRYVGTLKTLSSEKRKKVVKRSKSKSARKDQCVPSLHETTRCVGDTARPWGRTRLLPVSISQPSGRDGRAHTVRATPQ